MHTTMTTKPSTTQHRRTSHRGRGQYGMHRRPPSDAIVVSKSQQTRAASGVLRVIPVGGCEEVGRNMTIFEYGNDIIIIDMGLQWPEEDMPGIDYIIPNIEYLKGKEKNIRGIIITHGHYDHI